MDIQKFIASFTEQLDDAPDAPLTAETKFRELSEWSSLLALSIIALADEEYGVTLKGSDIIDAQTLGDIFKRITELRG